MARNDLAKAATVLLLVLLYSAPFLAIFLYSLDHITADPVFDQDQAIPVVAKTLANGQEVLLAGVQRLIVPLIAGLSVLWLGQTSPAAIGGGALPPSTLPVERLRFTLLLVAIAMIVVVVWDYIVIQNWSNFDLAESQVKAELLQFHQAAIQNYLVMVAIVLGISLSK